MAQNKNISKPLSKSDKHEMFSPMLSGIYNETKTLSQKKPNESLNTLKVKMINKILVEIRSILESEDSSEFLELLDNETLPSNSDAVFILSQYLTTMKAFREKYYGWDGLNHRWFNEKIK
jgi:hypothetical protein